MNKQLSLRAKTIISFVLFALVFSGLTIIASFYDLDISKILTKNCLKDGAYISSNVYTLFFEALGSCPIYLMASLAGVILFYYGKNHNKKWLSVIAFVVVVAGFFLTLKDVKSYYTEALTAGTTNGIPLVDHDFKGDFYMYLVLGVIALVEGIMFVICWSKVKPETNDKLLKLVAVILVSIVGYLIVELIKGPMGRMRFRTMNATGDTEFTQFTDWWVKNGKRKLEGLPSDNCKSFPSGHTYSAGLVYVLICLPDLLPELKKKKWVRPTLYAVTIIFTMLVAISRIACGAHYMSDVLFGGTISFLMTMLGREIIILKGAHFKALIGKEPEEKVDIVETDEYDKMA